MPENLENSAVATGLKKDSFHSNPKESQCQRMLKLPHNCTHLTHSSVLAWRIPVTGEPGRLPSMGSHRVRHDWSDLAVAAAHASEVMLKILQARLQQYVNHELPDVQAGFRKGRGTKYQIAHICWIMEKESSRTTSTSALLTMPKTLTVWITINCGKFFKKWEYQTTDLPLEKPVCRSGSNS